MIVKKYDMYLACEENYKVTTYDKTGDNSIIKTIKPNYEELYKKYSTV